MKRAYTLTFKQFIKKFRKYYAYIEVYKDGERKGLMDRSVMRYAINNMDKLKWADCIVECVIEQDDCLTQTKGTVRIYLE